MERLIFWKRERGEDDKLRSCNKEREVEKLKIKREKEKFEQNSSFYKNRG